jgi:hypothetical protein
MIYLIHLPMPIDVDTGLLFLASLRKCATLYLSQCSGLSKCLTIYNTSYLHEIHQPNGEILWLYIFCLSFIHAIPMGVTVK